MAAILSTISLVFGALHFVPLRSPRGIPFLAFRLLAAALAPFMALCGLIGAVLGLKQRNILTGAMGALGLVASTQYVGRIAAVAPQRIRPVAPPPRARHPDLDVPFATVPLPAPNAQGERALYSDIWQPPPDVKPSGVALIYLHGSSWYLGDKGMLTRPLFRVLTGAGHVVMDIAYRMCPETDITGMIGDAWRAVAWMRDHAVDYGVDPERIVLAGTSAGGHISILAAYMTNRTDVIPSELAGRDLSVSGVIAISAPLDMRAMLRHNPFLIESAHPAPGMAYDPLTDVDPLPPPPPGTGRGERRRWQGTQARRITGLLHDLVGGGPEDASEKYDLASAGTHVRPGLPPTLIIQGEYDMLVPVEPARALAQQLREAHVPVDYVELPQTDHGFDLALPQISPPAQAAIQAILRFLGARQQLQQTEG